MFEKRLMEMIYAQAERPEDLNWHADEPNNLFRKAATARGGVLAHFGKQGLLDWRPIGPRRRTARRLIKLFAPELTLREQEQEMMTDIPFPIGPTVLGQALWFQRV